MTRRLPLAVWGLFAVCLLIGIAAPLSAQRARPRQHQHETLLLDIDSTATKKFTTVQTHLRVGQLTEAIELLRNIGDAHVGKLVATTPGRYVNVQTYVQMLSAGLPPEGLRIYRQQLDPVLKPIFEAARDSNDETALLKVLQQGYCCSFSDDALLLLGDMAWDAGDVWRARSYWEQILPAPRPKELGEPVMWLAYPDSDLDLGLLVGRLILCTIQSGDEREIERELAGFEERYPAAEGRLAGRQGNLSKILREVAREAEDWPIPLQTSVVETFAGSPQRSHVDAPAATLGLLRWQAGLKPFGEEPRRGFQPGSQGGLCYFPVVYGDVVFVNDDEYIYAFNLQTGKPAWSGDPTDARVYIPTGFSNPEEGPVRRGLGVDGPVGNIGLPRFTMTIADGLLFARMGSVQPYSNERSGKLVCLDLAHGEGKLVWETFASAIEPEVGGWSFEGSPLVMGGRVYVGMRRSHPQSQSNVACFDALTGKLVWNRKLCVGQANPNFTEFDINQHLLTWGEGTLFYTTHMGAVTALDPRSGNIKWIVSYPRVDDTKVRYEYAARLQRGPLPAMFADGILYVAPIDSDELIAFDAETGLVKWRRSFHDPLRALLGVSNGIVFASGPELWALAAESGKILWQVGDRDPETHGYGRGILVEDQVYWPTHEEIFVIDQGTGAIQKRLPLAAVHGQSGGNLLLTEQHLLVAQPSRLAVFSDFGPPLPRSNMRQLRMTRRQSPAARPWKLAREAVETQDWEQAADQFHRASQLARPMDEWMARPLSEVAAEREIDARLRQAWGLKATASEQASHLLDVALDMASDMAAIQKVPAAQRSPKHKQELATLRPSDLLPRPASPELAGRRNSYLLAPRSTPPEMADWIAARLEVRAGQISRKSDSGKFPQLQRVLAFHDVAHRVVTAQSSIHLDEAATAKAFTAAEQLVIDQPEAALAQLRTLADIVSDNNDRVRVWCGVAHCFEAMQLWAAAAGAWKQAALNSTPNQQVTDGGHQVFIEDLIRERFERPEYAAQRSYAERHNFPWPLRRHWQVASNARCRTIYPHGSPPAIKSACVLIDGAPVTCANLADGTTRWQLLLSHPLIWAEFAAEKLILGTASEVRAVSVSTGETIWSQHSRSVEGRVAGPSQQLISVQIDAASELTSVLDRLSTAAGPLTDFSLAGDKLLARQGLRDIVAWNVNDGRLAWRFTATRGLAPGWGLTKQHVVIGQLAPEVLIVLDRMDGAEVSRFPTSAANWVRAPECRADGTFVTVAAAGRIESWSKPGVAWSTDEGPRAWVWKGDVPQSSDTPEVFLQGDLTLVLLDGKFLTAVNSLQGNVIWKTFLGQPLGAGRHAIACDEERIYVATDGFLQAFDMRDGVQSWRRYLGPSQHSWSVAVNGATVMAYPSESGSAAINAKITVCDVATGDYLQRIDLPANQAPVSVYPSSHTTLVACGGTMIGFGK